MVVLVPLTKLGVFGAMILSLTGCVGKSVLTDVNGETITKSEGAAVANSSAAYTGDTWALNTKNDPFIVQLDASGLAHQGVGEGRSVSIRKNPETGSWEALGSGTDDVSFDRLVLVEPDGTTIEIEGYGSNTTDPTALWQSWAGVITELSEDQRAVFEQALEAGSDLTTALVQALLTPGA